MSGIIWYITEASKIIFSFASMYIFPAAVILAAIWFFIRACIGCTLRRMYNEIDELYDTIDRLIAAIQELEDDYGLD